MATPRILSSQWTAKGWKLNFKSSAAFHSLSCSSFLWHPTAVLGSLTSLALHFGPASHFTPMDKWSLLLSLAASPSYPLEKPDLDGPSHSPSSWILQNHHRTRLAGFTLNVNWALHGNLVIFSRKMSPTLQSDHQNSSGLCSWASQVRPTQRPTHIHPLPLHLSSWKCAGSLFLPLKQLEPTPSTIVKVCAQPAPLWHHLCVFLLTVPKLPPDTNIRCGSSKANITGPSSSLEEKSVVMHHVLQRTRLKQRRSASVFYIYVLPLNDCFQDAVSLPSYFSLPSSFLPSKMCLKHLSVSHAGDKMVPQKNLWQ